MPPRQQRGKGFFGFGKPTQAQPQAQSQAQAKPGFFSKIKSSITPNNCKDEYTKRANAVGTAYMNYTPQNNENDSKIEKAFEYISIIGEDASTFDCRRYISNPTPDYKEAVEFINGTDSSIITYSKFIDNFINKIDALNRESRPPSTGGRARKVHVGQRGGRYVIVKGRKRYI